MFYHTTSSHLFPVPAQSWKGYGASWCLSPAVNGWVAPYTLNRLLTQFGSFFVLSKSWFMQFHQSDDDKWLSSAETDSLGQTAQLNVKPLHSRCQSILVRIIYLCFFLKLETNSWSYDFLLSWCCSTPGRRNRRKRKQQSLKTEFYILV